jgi:hypothetical protein
MKKKGVVARLAIAPSKKLIVKIYLGKDSQLKLKKEVKKPWKE